MLENFFTEQKCRIKSLLFLYGFLIYGRKSRKIVEKYTKNSLQIPVILYVKNRTNLQLHQNKNTRCTGVFILVKCGIGFESRNHLIAGSTMSCCVTRCAWHTTYECPAVPRHQRGRGNQPPPPLKNPPNGGFFILIFLHCRYMCGRRNPVLLVRNPWRR